MHTRPCPLTYPNLLPQVISHNHYDHLDEQSVVALAAMQPPPVFFVPLGMKVDVPSQSFLVLVSPLSWVRSFK